MGGEVGEATKALPTVGKIVIADELHSVRESLALLLGRAHEVKTASSIDEAVKMAGAADLLIAGFSTPWPLSAASAAALRRLPLHCSLLLLADPANCGLGGLPGPGHAVAFLAKPFDVAVLRQKVRHLLAAPKPQATHPGAAQKQHYRRYLDPPFVPPSCSLLLRQVLLHDLPLLLTGETGTGKRRIALAIHQLSGRQLLCHKTADELPESLYPLLTRLVEAHPRPASLTLYLEGIERMSATVQHDLLLLMDTGVVGRTSFDVKVSVVASTEQPLDTVVSSGSLLSELGYRLGVMCVELPPLRERAGVLADLTANLGQEIAKRLGLDEPIWFAPSALERIKNYLWLGNLPELESVIARTAAIAGPGPLEASQLVFTASDALDRVGGSLPEASRDQEGQTSALLFSFAAMEMMLGGVAHELKNPMVTIKTFAQHVDSIIDDPQALASFRSLMSDAVERMDDLLERLLEFSRYREPVMHRLDLAELVNETLEQFEEICGRRQLRLRRRVMGPASVLADRKQVGFALTLLFDVLARETPAGAELEVSLNSTGELLVVVDSEFSPVRSVGRVLGAPQGNEEFGLAPVKAAIAAAMIRRNRGSFVTESTCEKGMTIRVRLQRRENAEHKVDGGGGNGKA